MGNPFLYLSPFQWMSEGYLMEEEEVGGWKGVVEQKEVKRCEEDTVIDDGNYHIVERKRSNTFVVYEATQDYRHNTAPLPREYDSKYLEVSGKPPRKAKSMSSRFRLTK
eukprot:TRINITY_DN2210_c0_g1_i1.p1 TRINITY_DN2210_c0_g1~~TRINITY_DN2210_c0_g1_i1.p1  ORF type:complete len:109 (+),score=27.19 TRINITY_DN2210_c0_g1_i1:63-389(+)